MWLLFLLLLPDLSTPLKQADTNVEKRGYVADIEVLKSNKDGIEFVYTPGQPLLDGVPYIPGTSQELEVGKPALPVRYIAIGVPVSAKVNVQIIGYTAQETTGVYIPPVFGFTEKKRDESIYSKNAFWPSEIVKVEEQALYRGQEVLRLRINPLKYNPISKTLLIYSRIRIKVSFYGGKGVPRQDRLFESVFKRTLINYEQARNWRIARAMARRKYHPGPWYKIELQKEGIYKITHAQLKSLGMHWIDPKTIKLYNGGSKMATENSDTLREIPICVLPDTSILFYGTLLDGWGKNGEAFINPYTNTNVYWLTYGSTPGRRDSISGVPAGGEVPEYFLDTLHIEEDIKCPAQSGLGWIWEKLERSKESSSFKRDYTFNTPGVYENTCDIRIAVYGWYSTRSNDDTLSNNMDHNIKLYLNGAQFFNTSWKGGQEYFKTFEASASGLHSGGNVFTLEMYKGDLPEKDVIFFDWFEVSYNKKYEAYDENLKFKGTAEPQEFEIQGFDTLPVIFEITDEVAPKLIYGAVYENGVVNFQGGEGVYYVSTDFKSPSIKKESPYNLWNSAGDMVDFVIITHPDFLDYSLSLKKHREKQGLKTEVFSLNDIYNNFSWGIKHSPYAIKNFLQFAYNNWGTGYCLLLGAGSYNYKDESLEKNRVPPYETDYCVGEYGIYGKNRSDDWWFTNNNLAIGRITAKTKEEARDVVCEKIPKYEKNIGVWQNRILFIADDEDPDGCSFVNHTEGLALEIPEEFDIFKVYLMNYPRDGVRKPTARNDLVRYWSKGSFLTFFGGHGNLLQLCHENVFWNPTDIEALDNGIKLPFSHFWSCGVGCFEREYQDGMADKLQKINNKGSIGAIASTRSTGGAGELPNNIINYFLWQSARTIGEGIYGANLSGSLLANMTLFADPATQLPLRSIEVMIDSFPDTLKGGKLLKISGKSPGAKFAYITARSSEYDISVAGCTYKIRGRMINDELREDILFEGITPVNNGEWHQEFFIPVDIDSVLCGENGKISVFAWNDTDCGSSSIKGTVAQGELNIDDTIGPKIELFAFGKLLKDKDLIPSNFTLTGVLEDASGINTFNKTSPVNLILQLAIYCGKQQPTFIPLADYFQYDPGSGKRGSFQCPVTLGDWDIEDTLKIQASDNLGNRSVYEVIVKVESSAHLKITKVLNYPNPVRGEHTSFQFFLSKPAPVSVKVYTVAGKLIKTIPEQFKSSGHNKIYWDTRDELGNRVGNGIYIYKILASSEGLAREETSKISKLMILR